ncbi:hypothetical protein DENSPDRAFT_842076 [Dentipellis sp. KUC8613]|nr:hypothetical protein DENSPDRAFT_842076 [Dentipellis sp. KUC8613]
MKPATSCDCGWHGCAGVYIGAWHPVICLTKVCCLVLVEPAVIAKVYTLGPVACKEDLLRLRGYGGRPSTSRISVAQFRLFSGFLFLGCTVSICRIAHLWTLGYTDGRRDNSRFRSAPWLVALQDGWK